MKFREIKLIYRQANAFQERVSDGNGYLDFLSDNFENSEQNPKLLETLKYQKDELVKKIELAGVLTLNNKKSLTDLVKSAEEQTEFEKLAQLISKAVNYGKRVLECNLFTRKQIFEIMEYVGDAKNIHTIDAATKLLEGTMIPEQQKRMERELYWRKIDPAIITAYQAKSQAQDAKSAMQMDEREILSQDAKSAMQMDEREILCQEVRSYLVGRYKVLLSSTFDITSSVDAKKVADLMRQFEATLGDDIVDFDDRNKALMQAKDFLLEALTKKAPAYKAWYSKVTEKWAKSDGGRLLAIFELMQKSTIWDVDKTEKVFELAKEKYEKELKSRFLQVLDACVLDGEAKKSWQEGFEQASLEEKVDQFEDLQKNNKKCLEKDNQWFRKLDMIARNSPAIYDRFNEVYEAKRFEMKREDILQDVNDKYRDLECSFRDLLQKSGFAEDKKRQFLLDFRVLPSFLEMESQIVFVQKEMNANNDAKKNLKPTEKAKSDKEKMLKNDLEIDGMRLALIIDAQIAAYYGSHSVESDEGILVGQLGQLIKARQVWSNEVKLEDSIDETIDEEVDVEELGTFDETVEGYEAAGMDADPLIDEFVEDEEEVYTADIDDFIGNGNVFDNQEERKKFAKKAFGAYVASSAESHDARGFRMRVVKSDQEMDFRKDSTIQTVDGDFVDTANDVITDNVCDFFGIAEPTDALRNDLLGKVVLRRDGYMEKNGVNLLKEMSGNDARYAA